MILFEVRHDSLLIDINFISKRITEKSFNFGNLYACDPAINFDRIKDIQLYSDNQYNNSFSANSNLVSIVNFHYNKNEKGMPLKDNIGNLSVISFNYLKITVPPSQKSLHTFTISIAFENNKILTKKLQPIFIK